MNGCGTVVLLVLSQAACVYGQLQILKMEPREAKYAEAIKKALATEPTEVAVKFLPSRGPSGPADVVMFTVSYDKANSFGYEKLRIEGRHNIGKDEVSTSLQAVRPEGDKEVKVLVIRWEPLRLMETEEFEKDRYKLASAEKLCTDVRDALVKTLPKQPAAGR